MSEPFINVCDSESNDIEHHVVVDVERDSAEYVTLYTEGKKYLILNQELIDKIKAV